MGKKKYSKQHRHRGKVTPSEWQHLSEEHALRSAYLQFAASVQKAQEGAHTRSLQAGLPVSSTLDLRDAGRILDQHPQLIRYLHSVMERQQAERDARDLPLDVLATKSSPTGTPSQAQSLGGWSGYQDKNAPQGVPNARLLRDYAEQSEWVNAAINYYCERIGRADIAVLPQDERLPYNRSTEKSILSILDQPNEMGDTFPGLMRMCIRDMLTLGRGVLSKNMTAKRTPTALYAEDAAYIKIYPAWAGNPDEPRYLYDENNKVKIPLRSDEVICMMYGMSSYRFSLSPVQVLRNTILADLKATESASRLVDMKPPPHVIQLPGATASQIQTLRTTYESEIAGHREILFLGGDNPAQIKPLIFSLKDNQWMEWLEYLARKVAVLFGLSVQTFSFTGDVNRATAGSQQEIEENKGLIPLMLLIEEYLNRQYVADFAPKARDGRANMQALNMRAVFPEISETARMLHAEQSIEMASKSLAGLPSATLNQILMMRGEEPVKGGNTFYAPSANGPIPWLSYDNETGDYSGIATGGTLGAQDADGGPSIDDTTNEDMGQSSQGEEGNTTANPGSGGESASPNTSVGSSSPSRASEEKRYKDYRRPGTRWTPSTMMTRLAATPESVPRLPEDTLARAQLAATAKRIFGEVEKRAHTQLREVQ